MNTTHHQTKRHLEYIKTARRAVHAYQTRLAQLPLRDREGRAACERMLAIWGRRVHALNLWFIQTAGKVPL